MAQKLLPPAKIDPSKLLGGSSLATTIERIRFKSTVVGDRSLELGIIKKQVIRINDLVKTNTLLKVKEEERKRKLAEQKRFSEREEKLESSKENMGDKIPSLPSLPKLGFLDRIKSFLFNIFLGYISLRLLPYLPKLAGVVGTIVKVQDVIIDISGKILNGLVSFVDKAYEVHDKTRKFLGDLGGESFTKTFDGFIGAMDKVILASIAAAIAFGELRDTGGPSPDGFGGGRRGQIRGDIIDQGFFNKKTGRWQGSFSGKNGAYRTDEAARRYARRFGRDAAVRRFGERGVGYLGGKYARSQATNLARRGIIGLAGKGGTKLILGTVRPLLKRLPIIGALLDFGLSVALGEDPGRAAFKSIGAGLLGSVGAAVGSLAFGFGGIVGGILGSIGGDAIGGALYDMFFGNKNPASKQKVQGLAQGGTVTRGGQLPSSIKRTVQKPKITRSLKVQTTEVKPGQSVGGEDKIEKVFPETETRNSDTVNPLGYMKSSYKTASSTLGFGGIAAIFMKAQLGEQPSNVDYQNAADGLTAWMQRTLGGGIQRTGGAFAGGGEVDVGMFSNGDDMKNIIAKSLQESVAPKVEDMINDLKKQIELKPREVKKEKEVSEPSPGEELGNATEMIGGARLFMDLGFPPLAAAILAGNVQAESGWKGQRTPWVLNDGAGTNKGLISWNRSRITNAEKFLGKPLETASNAEQVKWIKEELRQYGLLDEFMDPNRTEAQLKSDSYKYIGWGIEGDRWKYSSRIYSALQRGERGSYVPSTAATLGTGSGSLAAAKSLAESMGLQLTSYVRPGDPGYHGKGRAMDFQTVGAPGNTGTPSQLAYAQKMVSQYGTSLKQLIYTPLGFGISNGKRVKLDYWGDETNSEHYHHVHVAFNKGGKVKGKRGIDQIRAMLTHGEFVIDVDSTTALEKNFPGFLDALNKANYDGAINVLRSYAQYEQGSTIHAVVDEKLIPVPIPISSPQQSPVVISSGFGGEDSMSSNYMR